MGRIQDKVKYPLDKVISGDEYLIGSDPTVKVKTMNFLLSDLAEYFTQYFGEKTPSVKLNGDVAGGDGIYTVSVEAQPSIIFNRTETEDLALDSYFMQYSGGNLFKVSWNTIATYIQEHGGGGYIPPDQTSLNLVGGGITFVSGLKTNNKGAVESGTLTNIQDGTADQKGVLRIAKPSEYLTSNTTLALPPDALNTTINNVLPNQIPLNLIGSGLTFLGDIKTNSKGAVESAIIRTVQDGTPNQKGVLRIAQPSEYNGTSTDVALPPNALGLAINNALPNQTPVNLNGGGLSFLSNIKTNNKGVVESASVKTIQDGTTIQKGVLRIAQPSEYLGGATDIALPPDALSAAIGKPIVESITVDSGVIIQPTDKLIVYITYFGDGGIVIELPTEGLIEGQAFYVHHPSSGDPISVRTSSYAANVPGKTGIKFVYIGTGWVMTPISNCSFVQN